MGSVPTDASAPRNTAPADFKVAGYSPSWTPDKLRFVDFGVVIYVCCAFAIPTAEGGLWIQETPETAKAPIRFTCREEGGAASLSLTPNLRYFNPRLPCGGRQERILNNYTGNQFQSSPPLREATRARMLAIETALFQSTPPAREVTTRFMAAVDSLEISIHASLAGGDNAP